MISDLRYFCTQQAANGIQCREDRFSFLVVSGHAGIIADDARDCFKSHKYECEIDGELWYSIRSQHPEAPQDEPTIYAFWDNDDRPRYGRVLNPGDWFGKAWLVFVADCYHPTLYVVEAGSCSDALEEFVESYIGANLEISDSEIGDYDLGDITSYRNGTPCDTESVMIHGAENRDLPFTCRYWFPGAPERGIDPRHYSDDLREALQS